MFPSESFNQEFLWADNKGMYKLKWTKRYCVFIENNIVSFNQTLLWADKLMYKLIKLSVTVSVLRHSNK